MTTLHLRVGLAVLAAAAITGVLSAQVTTPARPAPVSGPVIEPFGSTYAVPDVTLATPTDVDYKVAFDVSVGQTDPKTANGRIDTVARFINMHVRAGVPMERVRPALVLHGTAVGDALDHAGYRARHGTDNPNLALLEALARSGVRVIVCGQSAASRGLGSDEFAPLAKIALSAMTAHAILAREGYSTNPF